MKPKIRTKAFLVSQRNRVHNNKAKNQGPTQNKQCQDCKKPLDKCYCGDY